MPSIQLTHDGEFDIALGKSRHEVAFKNKVWKWSDFVTRVSITHRTHETYREYVAAKPAVQSEIKDCGCFVGGFIATGRRKSSNLLHRQIITLDIDHLAPGLFGGMWDDIQSVYGNAACLYSTHKHSLETPRYRLIMPLDRPVGPDEYEAIGRRIAGNLGIESFDHTTFQPSRLMYWPSSAKDGAYEFHYQDGPWLNADAVLLTYRDWKDSNEWPVSEQYTAQVRRDIKVQGNPLEKTGIIGVFCRQYTIAEAIDKFLSDEYEVCDVPDRYTYRQGSTTAGLVVYDDIYAYSHHGTDPTSMKLCNAFDLVRIHLFGNLDKDDTSEASFKRMIEFCSNDPDTSLRSLHEHIADAEEEFTDFDAELEAETGTEVEDAEIALVADKVDNKSWQKKFKKKDKEGLPLSTVDNIVIILENDVRLKGRIYMNVFEQREAFNSRMPWHKPGYPANSFITDQDIANLQHYLERLYNISSVPKIEAALKVILSRNQVHPIKDYLSGLVWDGTKRVETLLVEYLGVADSPYTRAITRKVLAAAVARIYNPGCKFDYVLTLIGKQGLKKSSLIDRLGGAWFSDSFTTVQGKEAWEQLQGAWLIEIAELSGMKKADIETVKHFITKRKDRYRVAYGRRVEEFPRQCIFFATTNDITPLRDVTGNRRFWLAIIHAIAPAKDAGIDGDLTPAVVDQIWAEAVALYNAGEKLYLTPELEAEAATIQDAHSEQDSRFGMVATYLDMPLPANWDMKSTWDRIQIVKGVPDAVGDFDDEMEPRNRVCVAEIWCELFDGKLKEMTTQNTKPLHDIMRNMPGWKQGKTRSIFKGYGNQIIYYRVKSSLEVTKTGDFIQIDAEA